MCKSKVTWSVPPLRTLGFALLLAYAALSLSGCPALIVPGLAYQGYKAFHQNNQTTTSAKATPDGSVSGKQSSGSGGDNSIE